MIFPTEIWLQVADHLPPLAVADLYAVSSQWFDIAMNARYHQISFAFLNRAMLRNLARLKDPAVARRVRTLHSARWSLLVPAQPHSLRGKLKLFRDHKRLARCLRTSAVREFSSPADLIRTMLDVIGGLPYVTTYHVAWSGLHPIQDLPVPFLAAGFRPSVLQLTLEISLEKTVDLLCHTAALENLEELDLFLRLDHLLPSRTTSRSSSSTSPPRSIASTPRSRSSPSASASRSTSPRSSTPCASCPPSSTSASPSPSRARNLGHPSGLGRFLYRHRRDGLAPAPDALAEWLSDALSYVTAPLKLRTLKAGLALFPPAAAAMCVGRFARTLNTLVLTGRALTYDHVAEILSALRRGVPSLSTCSRRRCPAYGASSCSSRTSWGARATCRCTGGASEQDDGQIGNFFVEMEQRRSFHTACSTRRTTGELFMECIPVFSLHTTSIHI
ncbi:hypothetical protein B0H10DRAFT_1980498 [Mycena sp. CBHHK59/15]|nr:hypothetical protein B0H10DRAFT_1980498 [Mycena sp. CBHHK59/15]